MRTARDDVAGSLRRLLALVSVSILIAACSPPQSADEIVVQRFFGVCDAQFGGRTDVESASSECGIITTLINRFQAEHPEILVRVNPVPWPGYDQLAAQLVTNSAPDLVTMHSSVISDYQARNLLEPLDRLLESVQIAPAQFTDATLRGVSKQGCMYGLPFDTWAPLWHINMNYFRAAGLLRDGKPILPTNPEELLAQARHFTRATGKPYFVQILSKERVMFARNLYTYLMQQNAVFFTDPTHIRLMTPEATRVLELFKTIHEEDLTTKNQDYAAALNGFLNGAGGVYLGGTWLIADFHAESLRPNRPLSNGYTVKLYPQLYSGSSAVFADGHAWVVPTKKRTPRQKQAVAELLRFLVVNNGQWARTGHLPAAKAALQEASFRTLPYRSEIVNLADAGTTLPESVPRQFAIQDIVGEEVAAAVNGQKPVDNALADAERRVNSLFANLPGGVEHAPPRAQPGCRQDIQ